MSYDFDGHGDANLNVATPIAALPLTMACWFKVDTDGEGHTLICLGNAANSEIFRLGASMDVAGDPVVFRASTSGGSQSNINTSSGATLDTWHHACAVASNSTNRAVYLDGANKTTIATGTRTISAATLLAIGAQYQAGSFGADSNGKVAHVAIWDVALSDGEVASLAAGDNPLTIQPDHLIAYWPLTADLVDLVDGLTLTNGGGATLSGDNPAVDPPSGPTIVTVEPATLALAGQAVEVGGPTVIAIEPMTLAFVGQDVPARNFDLPTIDRPAGGGDVDVGATVITDGYTAAPTIELFGHPENNENISGTRWEGFYATIDLKQTGRTPTFKLDYSNWRQSTPPTNNRLYWRYGSDIGDMSAWAPFDSRSVSGSVLTFSKTGAFAESVIQIANIPPVPYEELEDWLATWDANMFRPAACATLDVSSSAPNKYAYYDFPDLVSPNGIQVGSSYAFAFGITNAAATGPKKRLFHTWTHAGEWGGLRAMLRFAERLMSVADADHDVLRDDFEHVFLITNTAGMVGGMARGAAEAGDVGDDPNRVWGSNPIDRSDVSDPILSIEASVALLVAEWGVDGANRLQCAGQIAWHSHTFSNTKFGTYKDGMSAAESAFIGYVEALYGSTLHNYGGSSTGSSTAFGRTGTTGGFGVTFEWSYAFADFLNEIGTSADTIAPALVDAYQAGYFGTTIPVEPVTVASVGQTIGVVTAASVSVTPAVLNYAANDIEVREGATIGVSPVTLAYSASAIVVSAAREIPVAPVILAASGQDIAVTTGNTIGISAAALGYAGQSITVSAALLVSVSAAALTYSGQDVEVTIGSAITVSAVSLGYAGQPVTVIAPKAVPINARTLAYLGGVIAVDIGGGNRPPESRRLIVSSGARRFAA